MAKSLRELAAERGFVSETEPAQEVQQPTQPAEAQYTQSSNEQATNTVAAEKPLEVVFTPDGKEFVLPDQLEEWRKDNPTGAAIYEEELANKAAAKRANEIIKNLPLIQFAMDFLRDPDDAFLKWAKDRYTDWSRRHFETLIARVHKKYGDNIEQLRNPQARTAEQQQRIAEESQWETVERINLFLNSNYMRALSALGPITGKYPPFENEKQTGEPGVTEDSEYSLKEMTVLYFFAKHSEISPDSNNSLTASDIDELFAIFYRMDNYFVENAAVNNDVETEKLYFDFIEHDNRPEQMQEQSTISGQQSKISAAEQSNALMTIGNRLFVPSDPEYQNAFITSVSANIGLFTIDESGKKRSLALTGQTEFIRMLAKAVLIDYWNGNKTDMGTSIYFPTIARELGYDINHRQADKGISTQEVQESYISRTEARTEFVHSVLHEIDNIWGKLPHDATEYKLISVLAYNPETEVLYFVSPYLQRLVGVLVEKESAQLNGGKNFYLWNCDLLHASAANERNKAAVEMATRILVGVQQRGLAPDSKLRQNKNRKDKDDKIVTWHISCKGLIEDCPQIRERLKTAKNTSNRTQIIQRAFKAMYRILKNKTDLFSYYSDLSITEIIPTATTLAESDIEVTHRGGNPKYKRPTLPLKDSVEPAQ